jgi:hypothetical protein
LEKWPNEGNEKSNKKRYGEYIKKQKPQWEAKRMWKCGMKDARMGRR